jgi:hypothetical protein
MGSKSRSDRYTKEKKTTKKTKNTDTKLSLKVTALKGYNTYQDRSILYYCGFTVPTVTLKLTEKRFIFFVTSNANTDTAYSALIIVVACLFVCPIHFGLVSFLCWSVPLDPTSAILWSRIALASHVGMFHINELVSSSFLPSFPLP